MRILHVIQELGIGGAERMTAALVTGARRAGHQVAVAAAPGPMAAALDVPIFTLPMVRRRVQRLPAAARAVRRALRSWSPDVVHCHNPGMALAVALATVWQPRRTALVTIQGVRDEDYRKAARLLRWLGMPAVACGPGVAAALQEEGLTVHTIVNGVSSPPRHADRASLEHEWECLRERKLLVAAGRLAAQKNFTLAIRALAHIPDAALVIVGDGPLRHQLVCDAAAAGVRDRVVLTGFRADYREIIGAADASIVSSQWEGLPMVALEALAAGRPLVAVKARWQHAVLAHEEDCLLVEANDPAALAAAVRRVLGDSALSSRLSNAAARLAASYTQEATVSQYLQLYETLVSR